MARRKKEPEEAHRERIATAAEQLFARCGIGRTTMDEIAGAAGYSKATLYVYFRNKEEVVGYLVRNSMTLLYQAIAAAIAAGGGIRRQYGALCRALTDYQARFPFYFEITLGEIKVDLERPDSLHVGRDIYELGERINQAVADMIREGMACGALRPDLDPLRTVYLFWGSLSGIIQLSANKEAYLEQALGMRREEFLAAGFDSLYRMIERPSGPAAGSQPQ